MTESGPLEAAAGDDPDAPWRADYAGPEPKPPPVAWAEPTTRPAEIEPPGAPTLDPWSREADGAAASGSEAGSGVLPSPTIDPHEAERAREAAVAEAPSSAGPGLVGAVGLLVVICLVVAAIAAAGLVNDGDERRSALRLIPASVDELWSANAQAAVHVVIVDDVVVVSEPEGVRGFDARTGEERWSRSPDTAAVIDIQEAEGVVLVLDRSSDSLVATGIDPETGDELWNRNVAERRDVFALRERIIEYEFDQETQSGRFAVLSPQTGLPTDERLRLLDVATTPPFVSSTTIDTEELVLYDVEADERIDVPVDPKGLDAVTIAGGRLLALTGGGTLALYDEAGEIVDEIDVTLGPGQRVPDEIFPVPGEANVVLGVGDTSVGVEIDGDVLEIGWSAPGQVRLVELTDDGPRALLSAEGGDAEPSSIIDPLDGEIIFELDADANFLRSFESESYGRNGLLYQIDRLLIAVDGSGESMWELDDVDGFVVDDGLLVVIDEGGITVYG